MKYSLLDTDEYKLTMQQAVFELFPEIEVSYRFTDRGNTSYSAAFLARLWRRIDAFCMNTALTETEAVYLASLRIFKPEYISFLKKYRFNKAELQIRIKNGQLHIDVIGPMIRTILWEVPLLAMISEAYFEVMPYDVAYAERVAAAKFQPVEPAVHSIIEFGTRRRASQANQALFIETTREKLLGTSNLYFAMTYGLRAFGTVAHEWIMLHGALYGYQLAERMAMLNWQLVYGAELSVALPDTYTTDHYIATVGADLLRSFDGVRQDSGAPMEFVRKFAAAYEACGVDPKTKLHLFSDDLKIPTAIDLLETLRSQGYSRLAVGIGTNLTNDIGYKPLKIVMKLRSIMTAETQKMCVKLSDEASKHTGDAEELKNCLQLVQTDLRHN